MYSIRPIAFLYIEDTEHLSTHFRIQVHWWTFSFFLPVIPPSYHSPFFVVIFTLHHLGCWSSRPFFSVSVILYVCYFSRNIFCFLVYSVIALIMAFSQTDATPSHCVGELCRHWRHYHLSYCLIEEFGSFIFIYLVSKIINCMVCSHSWRGVIDQLVKK